MKVPRPFEMEFSARLDSIPLARHELGQWLRTGRVPSPICEELALVVTELVTNAVEASPSPAARVEVWARFDEEKVILRVSDEGEGFEPEIDPTALPELSTERGRGLPIVNALMDEVNVHRNTSHTVVEVARSLPNHEIRELVR